VTKLDVAGVLDKLIQTAKGWAQVSDPIYTEAAHLLGLPPPAQRSMFQTGSLSGPLMGRHVEVVDGSAQNTQGTGYVVSHRPLGLGLRIRPHNRLAKISGLGGRANELVDDPKFAVQFRIDTNAPEAVVELLGPRLRAQLLDLAERYPSLTVGDTNVSVEQSERATSAQQIVATVNDLLELSMALAGEGRGDHGSASMPVPPPARAAEPVVEPPAVAPAPAAPLPPPAGPPEDTPLAPPMSPEPAVAPVRPPRIMAPEVAEPGRRPLPPKRKSTPPPEMKAVAADEAAVEAPGPESAVTAAPSARPSIPGDQLDQLSAIFADGPLRSRVSFDRDFAGRPVEWSGTVRSTADFRTDVHFGRGEGVRATIAVGEISVAGFGTLMIEAVVQLPAGTVLRPGEDVTFRGALLKLDGLTRNVYVADAALV